MHVRRRENLNTRPVKECFTIEQQKKMVRLLQRQIRFKCILKEKFLCKIFHLFV